MEKLERVDEFVQLYTQNSRRIYGFIRSLVSQQPDAEDIFQDVGKTMWEKFADYRTGTSFLVWAFSISHFKVLQHRRTQTRSPASLSDVVLDLIANDMLTASSHTDPYSHALAECMKRLNSRDRELIDARYSRGQTTKTVAETGGRSIDSVYRALRRIHKALLLCMQRRIAEEGMA